MNKHLTLIIISMICLILASCGSSASPAKAVTTPTVSKAVEAPKETSKPKNTPSYSDYEDEEDYDEEEKYTNIIDLSAISIYELEDYGLDREALDAWLDCHDVWEFVDWEAVDSSAIEEVAYVGWPYYNLFLTFTNHPEDKYMYYDVPEYVYEELIYADSIGKYFNKEIKGQYDYDVY